MSTLGWLALSGAMVGSGMGWGVDPGQRSPSAPPDTARIVLDVPYLAQSVLLCGGAAVAMVERWWGRRGVYAEDFASLVRPELGGILTTELDSATRSRGWATQVFHGTPDLLQASLRDRIPVVALIQVAPDQYHYVVVVGWEAGTVTFHDPAGAPFTSLAEPRFLAQWQGAGRWAMVIRIPVLDPLPLSFAPALPARPNPLPCVPWMDQALDAVALNQFDEAARLLGEARHRCSAEPLVVRELAAVRFRQGRHLEAASLAKAYLGRVPGDTLGWQLLASTRFLHGDTRGALRAWNRIGRPTLDLVRIDGAGRIRYAELMARVGVSHGTILTPRGVAMAQRRLSDTPALRVAQVAYHPVVGGLVELRATVATRPTVASPWRLVAGGVIGALGRDAVELELATPLGAGELWTGQWRWDSARARVALEAAVPAHLGTPGVLTVGGAWDRVRVAGASDDGELREDAWRSSGIRFEAWVTPWVRPAVSLGMERWSGAQSYLTLAIGADLRLEDDRLRITMTGLQALPLSGQAPHRRGGARAMWTSAPGLGRPAWSARAGGDWTSRATPLGVWPVAGGNLTQAIPLRAEPSRDGGPLPGRTVGRTILHAGLAGDHPVHRLGPLVVAVGAFLDGARVQASADPSARRRSYLDGGVGVRVGLAEGTLGVLRVDVARGLLSDRRAALTVGFHRSWPPYPQASR